jgi:TRAP-type C4-dicarboxylate transport system substrate-binding protein
MRRLAGIGGAAIAASFLLTTAACSSGNKAGGAVQNHVEVLRLVSVNRDTDPQLQLFADGIARESHGSLRMDIVPGYRVHDPQAEKDIIADVRAGKADFAWVGARAWETVGINSFRALVAPFLIGSYPLQERVLTSPLAGQMLAGLRSHALVGLAVLPGPMRRVAGRRPLLRPADFAGITFATTPTATARATVRALGARPVLLRNSIPWNALPPGLGGLESQLHSIAGNQYVRAEPYLTPNLALWPRPLVVFANAKVYDSLSRRQRRVLQLAARDALAASTRAAKVDDTAAATQLCRGFGTGSRLKVISASRADLLALRRAVATVYRVLEQDPQTRSFIARIESFKQELKVPTNAAPHCQRARSLRQARRPIDGVYTQRVTQQQEAKNDHVPLSQGTPENWGHFVLVIDHGHFAFTQENALSCTWQYGTLAVKRKQMDWTFTDGGGDAPTNSENKPGEFFAWRWNLYRETLTLHAITPTDLSPQTWHRTSATPSPEALSRRCPPPKKAFPAGAGGAAR